jgi:hypothetical protein
MLINTLNSLTVAENDAGGLIGHFTGADPDEDVLTYSIVGGADATQFEVKDDALYLASGVSTDYESDNQLSVTLQATDPSGLSYQETVTVSVQDVNETLTAITLSNFTVAENDSGSPWWPTKGAIVGLVELSGVDAGDSVTLSLSGADVVFLKLKRIAIVIVYRYIT